MQSLRVRCTYYNKNVHGHMAFKILALCNGLKLKRNDNSCTQNLLKHKRDNCRLVAFLIIHLA